MAYSTQGKQAKHGKELAQRARAGILNAFDAVERRGVKISDALADAFLADPLKFMDTASKYIPKNIDLTVQPLTSALQLTDEELLQVIQNRKQDKDALEHTPGDTLEQAEIEQKQAEYAELVK